MGALFTQHHLKHCSPFLARRQVGIQPDTSGIVTGATLTGSIWVFPVPNSSAVACPSFATGCKSYWSAGGSATLEVVANASLSRDGDGYSALISGRTASWQGAIVIPHAIPDDTAIICSVWVRTVGSDAMTFRLKLLTEGSGDEDDGIFTQFLTEVVAEAGVWTQLRAETTLDYHGLMSTFKLVICTLATVRSSRHSHTCQSGPADHLPLLNAHSPTVVCPQPSVNTRLPTLFCPHPSAYTLLPTPFCPHLSAHSLLPTAVCRLCAALQPLRQTGDFLVDDANVWYGHTNPTFKLTLKTQGTGDVSASYTTLQSSALKPGTWTELSGYTPLEFTGGSLSTLRIYVQTGETDTFTDFYVDDTVLSMTQAG